MSKQYKTGDWVEEPELAAPDFRQVAAFGEDGNRIVCISVRSFKAGDDARLVAAAPSLLEKLRWNASWLRAALDCKAWHWDDDQREVAESDYEEAMALIASASPVAVQS